MLFYGFLSNFRCPKVSKGRRKALWCASRRILITPAGLTRRLRRGRWGCRPEGDSTFFRSERKYQRKQAARRLRRRPTSLRAVGFGLREPNGWTPRIYSGRPIPAVRPEQSDHVPWADCPQGLSSSTGCPVSHSSLPVALLASHPPCGSLWAAPKAPLGPRFPSGQFASLALPGKRLLLPILTAGRAMEFASYLLRSCALLGSPISAVKVDGPFSLRCLSPLCSPTVGVRQAHPVRVGMWLWSSDNFAAQKTVLFFSSAVGTIHT